VEDEQESLQCDDLVAEIEKRVTQLENVLTRLSSRYITRPKTCNEPSMFSCLLLDTMRTYYVTAPRQFADI
jgi:hypothetical protein